MKKRTLSVRIVAYLRQGRTLKEIAGMLGLGESFACLVANGHRNLTLEHLERLEKSLGKPLPQLLADVYRQTK